jgi:hypothetical protein
MVRSFDFANPDVHTPERHVTAAPQQALFLLNDPFVAERCRALARNLAPIPEADVPGRIRKLYADVLQQAPTASQMNAAQSFLSDSITAQSTPTVGAGAKPAASAKDTLLNPWEQLAQVLFFSNDFLFVE